MPRETSKPGPSAVFTTGSTMRHVVVMTVTAAIGLIAVFFVDAISLFYISQLNDQAQTAAVGRASYVLAFVIAISVGTMIGASVLVARAIGARRDADARFYGANALIAVFAINSAVGLVLFFSMDGLLSLLEADGPSLVHARTYLSIILPGTPFLGVGMVSMGLLRARGDANRAMAVTLIGGILTAFLDPVFIFVLDLQVTGAAIVSLIVRIGFAVLGLYFLIGHHAALAWGGLKRLADDIGVLLGYALPAMFTNVAAPVGAFLIAQKISEYGDAAIAGQAVVDRLIPLAFGVIFALSGAVGPIIGQNIGAGLPVRVRQTLIDALIFNGIYVVLAWIALIVMRPYILVAYRASGDMALMIDLFCLIVAGSFLFNGMLFVTNAAFNNLGKPLWATGFNWARQTLGVVPFIWAGAALGGLPGIAWGAAIGAVPFGLAAVATAFWMIGGLGTGSHRDQA